MITIKPFRAYRPTPQNVGEVACLPYDVMDRAEAAKMALGKPDSFLHVIRSEIDVAPEIDAENVAVYEKARENLKDFIARGVLVEEQSDAIYVYSQTFLGKTQTGIVALCAAKDYEEGRIKKHEHTLPKKEIDRMQNFLFCNAHTEPVFLAHKPDETIRTLVGQIQKAAPLFDFTTPQGVHECLWVVDDAQSIAALQNAFSKLDALYIADGHHRTQSAYRVGKALRENGQGSAESDTILSVIFPYDELNILPYNRIVKDLRPFDARGFLAKLQEVFIVTPCAQFVQPEEMHTMMLYIDKAWYALRFKTLPSAQDASSLLDVALLQENVFARFLHIEDPRTDERLMFVGGIRGEEYLMQQVDSLENACAFVLCPVRFSDIAGIADAGGVMPPKSTWFEPKLSSGLFIHKF